MRYGAQAPYNPFSLINEGQEDRYGCTPATCRCVGPTVVERGAAIREYVRAEDVMHLLQPGAARPPGYTAGDAVARWLRGKFGDGSLRYIDDPPECDLWGRPATTLRRGGGDCDDLAILVASILRAMRVSSFVVVGRLCQQQRCGGHAWVEGQDEAGWFMIECTTGEISRGALPAGYQRQYLLTPERGILAPGYKNDEAQRVIAQINASVARPRR